MTQKSHKFTVSVPEVIKTMMLQFIKASSTRRSYVSDVNPQLHSEAGGTDVSPTL